MPKKTSFDSEASNSDFQGETAMIFAFLNAAVFALLLQNLVFDGGFGMSEAIRIATKPKEFLPIAFTVAFFTGTTAAVCSALDLIPAVHGLTTAYHLLIYCAVLAAVYLGFTAVMPGMLFRAFQIYSRCS